MTFVTFTSEELATGPLSDLYPRLGSVGIITGQMDEEYNVQFSSDCFDDEEGHQTAEECALILSREEFESADIYAAYTLNNYGFFASMIKEFIEEVAKAEEEGCDCDLDCGSCHCKEEETNEEVELTEEESADVDVYKMLFPKFVKNGFVTESNSIESGFDVVRMVALAYKSGYARGEKGRPFKIEPKVAKTPWREMKPKDVYNTNLEVMYANAVDEDAHPEGPFDDGNGYFPNPGTIGKVSRPNFEDGDSDMDIWIQFPGTQYENTCYGRLFECFMVREVKKDD